MKKRPIIGISTTMLSEKHGEWLGYERIYANRDYINSVLKAGGNPILIPMTNDKELILEQVDMVDGLILTGGEDIFPYNYGQEPHKKLGEVLIERDEFDYTLFSSAKKRKIPILGICRGMQIINTFEGGTLYQDLSIIDREIMQHNQKGSPYQKIQKVHIEKNSKLYSIYKDSIMVNSFHHQAIDKLAENYKVIAKTSDNIIEGIEHIDSKTFILGVQWHPEILHSVCNDAQNLFNLFINHIKK